MKIALSGICVEDQTAALRFYTEVLGFVKKFDMPMGEHRWLTVVSPEFPDGAQLVLEPNSNPAARTFQTALKAQGIPWTSFHLDDIDAEFARLQALGVMFTAEPFTMGQDVRIAVFDDTCGNLIGLHQPL